MKRATVFALLFVLLACSDIKKGKQIEQVVLLNKQIDSLQNLWNKEDKKKLDSFIVLCNSKLDSISLLYKNQEIDLETAHHIDVFKQANKDFIELKKIHSFFPNILQEKKQNLKQLHQDISKGSGRREKYDEYIAFEQQEWQTIEQQFNQYITVKKRCLTDYTNTKNRIDTLLLELEKFNTN